MNNTTTPAGNGTIELFLDMHRCHILKREGEFILVMPPNGNMAVMLLRWLSCYHDRHILKEITNMISNEITQTGCFEITLNSTVLTPFASAKEYLNVLATKTTAAALQRTAGKARGTNGARVLRVPALPAAAERFLMWVHSKSGFVRQVEIASVPEPSFDIELNDDDEAVYDDAIKFINSKPAK